jgi:hypothetical protein
MKGPADARMWIRGAILMSFGCTVAAASVGWHLTYLKLVRFRGSLFRTHPTPDGSAGCRSGCACTQEGIGMDCKTSGFETDAKPARLLWFADGRN